MHSAGCIDKCDQVWDFPFSTFDGLIGSRQIFFVVLFETNFVPLLSFLKPAPFSIKRLIAVRVNTFDQIWNSLFSSPASNSFKILEIPHPRRYLQSQGQTPFFVSLLVKTNNRRHCHCPRPKTRRSEHNHESSGQLKFHKRWASSSTGAAWH